MSDETEEKREPADVKRDAILDAYDKLPIQQKVVIDGMVDKLIYQFKAQNNGQFSRLVALEIIGSIGLLQLKEEAVLAS